GQCRVTVGISERARSGITRSGTGVTKPSGIAVSSSCYGRVAGMHRLMQYATSPKDSIGACCCFIGADGARVIADRTETAMVRTQAIAGSVRARIGDAVHIGTTGAQFG